MTEFIARIKNNPDAIFGKGCKKEDIAAAEKDLGVRFAEDYREYLMNLSVVALDGREFTGITKVKRVNVVDVTKQQRKYNSSIPTNWYVIEESNIDGIVAWQDETGSIYETMPGRDAKKVADALEHYCK